MFKMEKLPADKSNFQDFLISHYFDSISDKIFKKKIYFFFYPIIPIPINKTKKKRKFSILKTCIDRIYREISISKSKKIGSTKNQKFLKCLECKTQITNKISIKKIKNFIELKIRKYFKIKFLKFLFKKFIILNALKYMRNEV